MVPGGGGHSDGATAARKDGFATRSWVLASLVLVFSGFWALVGVSLVLVSPFAASFSDDDSAADERQAMIVGAAAGVGLAAVSGWTAVAGTKHLRNRPRARVWTVVTFAVWAAVFAVFVVRTATGDQLRSDDEDTRGGARGGLVLQGMNLAGCLAIITLAAIEPHGDNRTDRAPRQPPAGRDGPAR
jgi:hypothetical protein